MEPHSNVYYVRNTDDSYTPCKSATRVRNEIGGDIFRYKNLIYEGKTGVFMFNESRLDRFLEDYKGKEDKFRELIQKAVKDYGLSPRYTQPEIKKDQLFPRDESHKLAKALYHKEKCYFSRMYNKDGIELYTMDKQKSSSPMLYTPCKDWMIGIGYSDQLEKVIEFLSKPQFNLYDFLTEKYEKEIQTPEQWADVGIAEFLGRREEADKHNLPIRETRDQEQRQREEKREAEKREREDRARLEYENAIKEAEKSLMEGREIKNKEIGSHSLFLQLFRENGIELPLKTQGWIKSSLTSICPMSNNRCSYGYFGRPSTVIMGYIDQLMETVRAKYRSCPVEPYRDNANFSYDELELDDEDDMEI